MKTLLKEQNKTSAWHMTSLVQSVILKHQGGYSCFLVGGHPSAISSSVPSQPAQRISQSAIARPPHVRVT